MLQTVECMQLQAGMDIECMKHMRMDDVIYANTLFSSRHGLKPSGAHPPHLWGFIFHTTPLQRVGAWVLLIIVLTLYLLMFGAQWLGVAAARGKSILVK